MEGQTNQIQAAIDANSLGYFWMSNRLIDLLRMIPTGSYQTESMQTIARTQPKKQSPIQC